MNKINDLLKSFVYAGRGIFECAARERNFRIHIAAIVTVGIFAAIYGVTRTEAAILTIAATLVPALEAVNTALESAVDFASKERSETAKLAKDAAAGAVLIAAVGAVAVAVFIFGDTARLFSAIQTIANFWYLAAAYVIIMIIFVFVLNYRRNL